MELWSLVPDLPTSEIIRNLGLVSGGAVGLVLAAMRVLAANRHPAAATREAELNRRNHVAELFNRAVGQLDDSKLQVRLGAMYTLGQVDRDFPDLTGAVFDILSVHIRDVQLAYGDAEPPPDVKAIMQILKIQLERRR